MFNSSSSSKEQKKTAESSLDTAPRHKDLLLMDAVRMVNADASTLMLSLYFSLAMDAPAPCLIAKKMESGEDRNDPIVAKLTARFRHDCDFTRLSRKLTLPVFEHIASTRILPQNLFAFEAFHDDLWAMDGLFQDIESCNSVREEASKRGIGTRACGKWQPRF